MNKSYNFNVQFHRPEKLLNPFPKYIELIKLSQNTIGHEQTTTQLEAISAKCAFESGYYFFSDGETGKLTFIHVSLNPNDFIEIN